MTTGQAQTDSGAARDAVFTSFVEAYYPTVIVGAPAAARARAQAGYTIAAAIATALVTAGVFTDFEKRHVAVKVLGGLALGAWIASALTFMWAVSIGFFYKRRELRRMERITKQNLKRVIEVLRTEEQRINVTIFVAVIFACVASAVTIATFLAALFVSPTIQANEQVATLVLGKHGQSTVQALCPHRPTTNTLSGKLDVGSLKKDLVDIVVPAGNCAATPAKLSIPRAQVLGVSVLRSARVR